MRSFFLSAVLVATSLFGSSPASAAVAGYVPPGPIPCYLCDVEALFAAVVKLIETPPLGPITCLVCEDTSNAARH